MLRLKVTSENYAGRSFPLRPDRRYVMGRSRTCDITIRDPHLSRQHIALHVLSDGIRLTDLGSSNGCKVNDEAVREKLLQAGDRIRLGETELLIDEGSSQAAKSTHALSSAGNRPAASKEPPLVAALS